MAQFLRPVSDVSAGGWTATPLFDKIDEAVASDVDFVTSNNNTSPDTFEVALTPVSGTPAAGAVTLRVRRSKSATGGHALSERFALYQGGTLIEELTQATPDSTAWVTVSLAIANRAAITDWTDLRVRVSREGATGGSGGTRRSLRASFVELEAPDSAAVSREGSGALIAPATAAAGAAAVGVAGAGGAIAPLADGSGTGAVPIAASGSAVAPASTITGSGTGSTARAGDGLVTSPAAAMVGAGSVATAGEGSAVATVGTAAGVGALATAGDGQAAGGPSTVAGSGAILVSAEGAAVALAVDAAGAGAVRVDGGGGIVAPAAEADGSGSLNEPSTTGGGLATAVPALVLGAGTTMVVGAGAGIGLPAQLNATGTVVVTAAGSAIAPAALVSGATAGVGAIAVSLRLVVTRPHFAGSITRRPKAHVHEVNPK